MNALYDLSRASHEDTAEDILAAAAAASEPADPTLTALAGLDATPGLVTQTGADTFTKRTLTTTADHLAITNPAGTAGNPLLELAVGVILTGTYTPTLTAVTNVAASTAFLVPYLRVGSFVAVGVYCEIDPTLAAPTTTTLGISLPIASDFANTHELMGTADSFAAGNSGDRILGDVANNRASLSFAAASLNNIPHTGSFFYRII